MWTILASVRVHAVTQLVQPNASIKQTLKKCAEILLEQQIVNIVTQHRLVLNAPKNLMITTHYLVVVRQFAPKLFLITSIINHQIRPTKLALVLSVEQQAVKQHAHLAPQLTTLLMSVLMIQSLLESALVLIKALQID